MPAGRRILDPASGLRDRTEIYNIPSTFIVRLSPLTMIEPLALSEFDGNFSHNHPAVIQEHLGEIEEFARVCETARLS